MSQPFRGALPDCFPDALLQGAQDLRIVGSNDVAWQRPSALRAIAWLAEGRFAILGGDVYGVDEQGIRITGDNWSCNWPEAGAYMDWDTYVLHAAEEARAYIDFYHQRNGDDYFYSVVVWNEAQYRDYLARLPS